MFHNTATMNSTPRPSCRLAIVPLAIACISASTIVGLGMMFLMGAINFVLAIGAK